MPKILTICQRGNVRSVTLSTMLKDYGMHIDVIPIGIETTSASTLNLLIDWSDTILIAGDVVGTEIIAELDKTIHLSIGRDLWGKAMHPELVAICLDCLEKQTNLVSSQTRWPKDVYQQLVNQTYERVGQW